MQSFAYVLREKQKLQHNKHSFLLAVRQTTFEYFFHTYMGSINNNNNNKNRLVSSFALTAAYINGFKTSANLDASPLINRASPLINSN